jgi:hypothetical protein
MTTTDTVKPTRTRRAPATPSNAQTDQAFDLARQLSLTGLAPLIEQVCADATTTRATYPGFLAAALQVEGVCPRFG